MPELSIDGVEVVRLSGKRTALIPDGLGEPAYFTVRVTVTNHSDATVHATAAITRLGYDKRSRTLTVGLVAPEQLDGARPLAVEYLPVEAGSSAVVEVRLASPVTFLGAKGRQYAFVDKDVDEVSCVLTYTDTPPPSRVNLAARSADVDRAWDTAEMRCPVKIEHARLRM